MSIEKGQNFTEIFQTCSRHNIKNVSPAPLKDYNNIIQLYRFEAEFH